MKTYTVVGVFEDDHDERFTLVVNARTAVDAEKAARESIDDGRELIVASVFEGVVRMDATKTEAVTSLADVKRRGFEIEVAVVRLMLFVK